MAELLFELVFGIFGRWFDEKTFRPLSDNAPDALKALRRESRERFGYMLVLLFITGFVAIPVLAFSSRAWPFLLIFLLPGLLGLYYGISSLYLLLNERNILRRRAA